MYEGGEAEAEAGRAKVEDKARALPSADLKKACDLLGTHARTRVTVFGHAGGIEGAAAGGGAAVRNEVKWNEIHNHNSHTRHMGWDGMAGVNRSGKSTKEELVSALVDWLEAPQDVGAAHQAVKAAAKREKAAAKAARKREKKLKKSAAKEVGGWGRGTEEGGRILGGVVSFIGPAPRS